MAEVLEETPASGSWEEQLNSLLDANSEAVQEFDQSEGIDACPEGAATLAGLRKLLEDGRVSPHVSTVLFNTGSGLKHPEMRPRARRGEATDA